MLLSRLCWQMLTPPQSLQSLLRRLCSQMLAPPQSLQTLLWRLCWQMLVPPQSLQGRAGAPAAVMRADARAPAVLADASDVVWQMLVPPQSCTCSCGYYHWTHPKEKVGNTGRYWPHVSGCGTSRERLDDLIHKVVDLKKLDYQSASLVPIGANLSDLFSIGRMLRHGGAPIWTGLTVKTGEITGIFCSIGKYGPRPIRTLNLLVVQILSSLQTISAPPRRFWCGKPKII